MTEKEIQQWASAYIRAQQDSTLLTDDEHPLWWAVEKFSDVRFDETSPRDAWRAILAVLALAPPEKVLAMLAAGPLTDLIEAYAESVIAFIEHEANSNPAFRALLNHVRESGTPEVWGRVIACRASSQKGNAPL